MGEPLDCVRCPSLCCRLAGYVHVRRADVRRLAAHLGLTVRAFERAHVVRTNRRGERLIKEADATCQFLGPDRMCRVYAARPKDCQGYVCWNQPVTTVYEFARFLQDPGLRGTGSHEPGLKEPGLQEPGLQPPPPGPATAPDPAAAAGPPAPAPR